MIVEVWKPVSGYEKYYMISNMGRLKSLHSSKERILSQNKGKKGYITYNLCCDGKCKTHKAHKLVAIEFLNHSPSGMSEIIDHINDDKTDNRVSNLRLTNNRDNVSKSKQSKNYSSKYTGVSWFDSRKKWVSRIYFENKNHHLGYFDSEKEASIAYNKFLETINN